MSNSSSKRDKILIVVTVVLLLVLAGSFIYDRNDFVLARTLKIEMTDDMKVVSMSKYGVMFYRKAYQARIRTDIDKAEEKLEQIATTYNAGVEIYDYEAYKQFASETFQKEIIRPEPVVGTEVAVVKATDGDHLVTFMMDVETDSDAFIYVYYNR